MSSDSPQAFGSPKSGEIPNVVLRDDYVTPPPKKPEISREDRAEAETSKLPLPTGYRILIVPYSQPRTSKGGILLADQTLKTEELATVVGYVIALGPDAYTDPSKFPVGAWCKPGDYVLFGRYAGARILMQCDDDDDLPLRLLNDDEILAVITNPEDYVGVN